MKLNKCKSCEGRLVEDHKSGDYVCIECGLCQGVIISMTDNMSYRNDDGSVTMNCQSSRIDELYPKSSMSTIIKGTGRLQTINFWLSISPDERSLWNVEQYLRNTCLNYFTDSFVKGVVTIYKQYIHNNSIIYRGRVRLGLIGACIYLNGVNINCPKSYLDISKMLSITELDVSQGYESLLDLINKKSREANNYNNFKMSIIDYVNLYCTKLYINGNIKEDIEKVVLKLQNVKEYSSHTPQSLITSVIYYVLVDRDIAIKKKDLGNKLGISEVTIIKIYKKMLKDDYKIQAIIN